MAQTSSETALSGPAASPAQPGKGRNGRGEVLVVNRDPETRVFLDKTFFVGDLPCVSVPTPREALACLERGSFPVVLVSIEAPESVELIARLHAERPDICVVAISSTATPELVRDVLCAGARDFIFGSFKSKTLLARLERLLAEADRPAACPRPAEPPSGPARPAPGREAAARVESRIICKNPTTRRVLEIARKVAPTDSTVLIEGESGTGKELLARYIHEGSRRAERVFIEVNCGALPENLLESQLFGHEKGSFTGASQRQLGLFEVADKGTIFLDEIGEMSLDMQVKILRVLQSREFRRIGGSQVIKVDVRVLAATNRDLKKEVERGTFRTDLYYRLNVIGLELPPLRERREEIPELVKHFTAQLATEKGLPHRSFTPAAIEALKKLRWEGNVRELENVVERLVLLAQGDDVGIEAVEEHLDDQKLDVDLDGDTAPTLTLNEVKKLHIARVLRQSGGNKMRTARMLKINVKTLYNLIRSLEIEV